MTWGPLKKTGDRKKKLFVHGNPFCNFFSVLVIINSGNPFFDEEDIVGNFFFPQQEMFFWNSPLFPCRQKSPVTFGRKKRNMTDSFLQCFHVEELKKKGKKFRLSSHEVIIKLILLNKTGIPDIPFANKPVHSG